MKQINVQLLDKMFHPVTSRQLIIQALKMYMPVGEYKKRVVLENIVCIIPAVMMGTSIDTYTLFLSGCENINGVIVAIFGIVFTGYALFQALINNELLIRMINENSGKKIDKNKLQETNETFTELMLLCVISIMINIFLGLSISSIPSDFMVFDEKKYNDILAVLLLQIYLVFHANIFLELKSFIFNTFQLFNLHAGTKIIEIVENDGKKK